MVRRLPRGVGARGSAATEVWARRTCVGPWPACRCAGRRADRGHTEVCAACILHMSQGSGVVHDMPPELQPLSPSAPDAIARHPATLAGEATTALQEHHPHRRVVARSRDGAAPGRRGDRRGDRPHRLVHLPVRRGDGRARAVRRHRERGGAVRRRAAGAARRGRHRLRRGVPAELRDRARPPCRPAVRAARRARRGALRRDDLRADRGALRAADRRRQRLVVHRRPLHGRAPRARRVDRRRRRRRDRERAAARVGEPPHATCSSGSPSCRR